MGIGEPYKATPHPDSSGNWTVRVDFLLLRKAVGLVWKWHALAVCHGVEPSFCATDTEFLPSYERRRPEETLLYKVIAENIETFIAETERDPQKKGLPKYVKEEFYNYLKCGVLQYGFLRVKCEACRHEKIVGFS